MAELLIALAVFAVLGAVAAATLWLPWTWLLVGGLAMITLGTLVGVPAGVYYHVVLRRELLADRGIPPRWYWRPHHFHDALSPPAFRRVRPWWMLGGGGFAVIVLGLVVTVLGLVASP